MAVAREHGVEVMFTLSGAHVFPMYDGAVTADPPMRIIDVHAANTSRLRFLEPGTIANNFVILKTHCPAGSKGLPILIKYR